VIRRQSGDRKLPGSFYRIWAASSVSSLGDGLYNAALPLLALTLTHNSVIFGVMEAVTLLPWLLFGLIGGALVDRWDRRTTMAITDLCRFALLVVAAFAIADGFLSVAILIAMGFLLGIGEVLFESAAGALVPEHIDRDQETLQRASSRLQGAQQTFRGFIGPPTGSVLFSLSRAVPFAADAITFLFSSLMIRTLPKRPRRPESGDPAPEERSSIFAEARAGASYLVHHRLLLGLALRPAVGNFAFCATGAVIALFARETLHLNAAGYGAFLTTEAVGGLAGTFVAGKLGAHLGTGRAMTLTALCEAAAILGIGTSSNAYVAGIALAVLGAAMGATMTLGWPVRQAIVPDELMGRVGAATRLTALGTGPFGALAGGWLGHVAGLRAPFLAGSGILLLMALLAARLTSNKRIDAALAEARQRREAAQHVSAAIPEGA
jgi:MFS family permease